MNILAVGEGLAALVKAGVAARTALHVLNASSGRSFVSEALVPERVLTGLWPRTFRLALLEKDVGIARGILVEVGISGPVLELAGRLLSTARAALGDDADYLEAIRLIERGGPASRFGDDGGTTCRCWAASFSFRPYAPNNSMSDWGATQRVPAKVVLAEGVVLAGELHLLARATHPSDTESPLEMLNRDDPFFALTQPEGGVSFVSKAQVSVVSCQDRKPLDDPERASAAKLVELSVELTDGVEYRGRSSFELPPARARALDYVNAPGRFFTLWTDDVTQYINKSLVRLIRPLD